MPNSSFVVPLNTNVRSSELTLSAVVENVRQVNNGNHPGVAQQVRDSNGKVVQVRITFPSAVSAAAIAAIKATPGVPTICADNPIPPQLIAGILATANGFTKAGAPLSAGQQIVGRSFPTSSNGGGSGGMGYLDNTGFHLLGGGAGAYTLLQIYNDSLTDNITLNSGDFVFHFLDTTTVSLLFSAPFVLPPSSYCELWVASSGSCYVAYRQENGLVLSGTDQGDYDVATSCYDVI